MCINIPGISGRKSKPEASVAECQAKGKRTQLEKQRGLAEDPSDIVRSYIEMQ